MNNWAKANDVATILRDGELTPENTEYVLHVDLANLLKTSIEIFMAGYKLRKDEMEQCSAKESQMTVEADR